MTTTTRHDVNDIRRRLAMQLVAAGRAASDGLLSLLNELETMLCLDGMPAVECASIRKAVGRLRDMSEAASHDERLKAGALLTLAVEDLLRSDHVFAPTRIDANDYARILRGLVRLNEERGLSGFRWISCKELAANSGVTVDVAVVGMSKMVDDGLAEYEFDPPRSVADAFYVHSAEAVSAALAQLKILISPRPTGSEAPGCGAVHFHGPIVSSAIQINSSGSQHISTTLDFTEARAVFAKAKDQIAQLAVQSEHRPEIEGAILKIGEQLDAPKPDAGKIRPLLVTAMSALGAVGASGDGVSYLYQFAKLFGVG